MARLLMARGKIKTSDASFLDYKLSFYGLSKESYGVEEEVNNNKISEKKWNLK